MREVELLLVEIESPSRSVGTEAGGVSRAQAPKRKLGVNEIGGALGRLKLKLRL